MFWTGMNLRGTLFNPLQCCFITFCVKISVSCQNQLARDWGSGDRVGGEMAYEPSKFREVQSLKSDVTTSHESAQKSGKPLEFYRAWNEELKAILSGSILGICKSRDQAQALPWSCTEIGDEVLNFPEFISSLVNSEEQQHTLYQVFIRIK